MWLLLINYKYKGLLNHKLSEVDIVDRSGSTQKQGVGRDQHFLFNSFFNRNPFGVEIFRPFAP